MSIIDTLIQYGDQSATFVVNTGVDYVNIINPIGDGILSIGGVFDKFQWKDNLNLLSICAVLPLGFEFYQSVRIAQGDFLPDHINFKWRRVSDGLLVEWQPARYNLPSANYEMNIGAFLEPPVVLNGSFNLVGLLPNSVNEKIRISMLNVPAALNEKTFACPVFAKVEHTLLMI